MQPLQKNVEKLSITNIKLTEGNFDYSLPNALKSIGTLDLAFVDGNHRKKPTLQYFKLLSDRINTSSILIFDDIHWSREMEEAWESIKVHTSVKMTIDLFFMGLVFFRDEFKARQHFIIRY